MSVKPGITSVVIGAKRITKQYAVKTNVYVPVPIIGILAKTRSPSVRQIRLTRPAKVPEIYLAYR